MTLDSLLAHAESTSSTLNYLLLRLLSLHTSDLLSHAASHMGVAQTIATLLRALPYHAAQRRMVIPAEITAKHGVNQEAVFRSIGGGGVDAEENGKKLEDAVFEFATVANDHVLTAREMLKEGGKVPARAMPPFLSMVSHPFGVTPCFVLTATFRFL
jgi:NADH dehydrogenase [ubiquinone] 1 alpha subcomplex assembly factor 6